MSGLWLLPTKGRPEQVGKFFKAWREKCASTPGLIIINADDFGQSPGVNRGVIQAHE